MDKFSKDKKLAVMTRREVRAFDEWAINELGIDGTVLMENAGRSCAELIVEKLLKAAESSVCILCGTGNNGGDGFVIARHLFNKGIQVEVVICGDREKIKGDAKKNLDIWEGLGQKVKLISLDNENAVSKLSQYCSRVDLLVDALFGTGLKGQLREGYVKLIDAINQSQKKILAVDIPSGLDCDSGEPLGAAVKADSTVTFVAVKKGFQNECSANFTGEIHIASIGVEPDSDGN
ncbi:MAG: NAD(P)H-hydrate epimerase [Planctomycetota bacterium]|jgi:NAD(P)H-hydrate epimerase